eukprot:Gb_00620 [translate_table: standard]
MISVTLVAKGPATMLIVCADRQQYITWSCFTLAPSRAKVFLQVLRPIGLAVVATRNPGRPVDGINTIGMLLTSMKVDIEAGYQGFLAEDEGRDLDYILLACLKKRQRFRCGGVLDDILCIVTNA